ncbi:uncharacterized protein LOC121994907 [Zingiber officinale]|uniref:uncharacterized protein LOC121994907 n=1 Tax=Zingiber officinale TaxID=94328 RepID=UPI001C4DD02C|nr:uncharacterized protein LOC121994907 [Zingiber officinale]
MGHMEGSQALVLFTLYALLYHSVAADHTARYLSEAEEKELQIQLKSLNKPYVKSFKDEYGITFDCVDIYKQPAFDHPLLKNHTLQIKSTSFLKSMNKNLSSETVKLPRRCPQGTVLIRRTTREDLIRAKQIQRTKRIGLQEDTVSVQAYTVGVSFSSWNRPEKFYGISADLDVYQLSGILDSQTSATQMIISKGERGPLTFHNVLQAGFHVHHEVEGDNFTHFFTYWTSDGYQSTGCFNIHCSGFVQTSEKLTPGLVYTLRNLALSIYRDRKTSNWMLYNDQEPIGYWPKEILNNMADSSRIQLSATASSPTDQPSPPTGNGELGGASFKKIRVLNGGLDPYPSNVQHAETFLDIGKPFYEGIYNVDSGFIYGGPGGWEPPKF